MSLLREGNLKAITADTITLHSISIDLEVLKDDASAVLANRSASFQVT